MKWKTILGLAGTIGFGTLLFVNFGSQVGGYMNFEQAARTGAMAHVVGTWAEDRPTSYDRMQNVFTFYMRDEDGTVRKVRYNNPKPANFEEAEQVVVEGRNQDGTFVAENILVKCPSKYNDAQGLKQKASRSSQETPPTSSTPQ
ncbi:cytochrome c maturation protein CcmE [Salinibacter ruber]|uniref:cytochrome c maturation protein CcmE n=1 Tax=Salinibacter ruber TaxID=146919 RepID=UPI0021685C32|nr:cytochrome c maturation protein CcmE [Salinibacter ruber]MCS3784584.1 cytochrome c-type biogenesis protein CcmE [Salinibacter ruber]